MVGLTIERTKFWNKKSQNFLEFDVKKDGGVNFWEKKIVWKNNILLKMNKTWHDIVCNFELWKYLLSV